jgi:hypothetical protein
VDEMFDWGLVVVFGGGDAAAAERPIDLRRQPDGFLCGWPRPLGGNKVVASDTRQSAVVDCMSR